MTSLLAAHRPEDTALPEVADFYSERNRRRIAVWTWVPPTPGPHPLLVLLHGVNDSGGHGWWLRALSHDTAASLAAEAPRLAPVLLMPGDTGIERGSAYADWADGSAHAESFLIDELLPWADQAFDLTGSRWITGLSMGGYGALLMALRHRAVFQSATSMSGFFNPLRIFEYVPDARERIWGAGTPLDEYDVGRLMLDRDRRDGLRIGFDCGVDDPRLPENRSLHEQLNRAGVRHGYSEHEGGHDWTYWRTHLGDHLRFHAGLAGPLDGPTT